MKTVSKPGCHKKKLMLARKVTEMQKHNILVKFELQPLLSLCANEIPHTLHFNLFKGCKLFHVNMFNSWDLIGALSYEALKMARGHCSSKVQVRVT